MQNVIKGLNLVIVELVLGLVSYWWKPDLLPNSADHDLIQEILKLTVWHITWPDDS